MALEPAPFHAEVAHGPEGGAAFWLGTADGVRIRAGHWPCEDARGTVLLFPGRTEYVEKYGMTAAAFAGHGFGMVAVDWRGQGLADRLLPDPRIGHVRHFKDYQHDVRAVLDMARKLDLPRPWYLIGHSMGGAIGLRAVMDGIPEVHACAFTGPMWGIRMNPVLRPIAWGLYYASGWTGQDHRLSPSTRAESYVLAEPFESNGLTTDPDVYAMMQRQVSADPGLVLGGPSLRWLGEALGEAEALARRPSPDLPCITFVGSDEAIVEIDAMRTRMNAWPGGRLEIMPESRHEVLMERAEIREAVVAQIAELFTAAAERPPRAESA